MRPTATLLLLALVTWFATLVAAGCAAMAAFSTLPKLGVTVSGVEAFFGDDTAEMGRYAAGRMLAPVFLTVDWVQFACSALAVGCTVRLARCGALRGARLARFALFGGVGTAAVLLAFHAWRAPAMNADLLAYWQAIGAGDRDAAAAARASFDEAHRVADAGFRMTIVAVIVAIAAFTAATVPGTKADAPAA